MNERIKELLDKCTDHTITKPWPLIDAEKFAKLIIEECAQVAGCNGHVSGFALGDLIKEHFGSELIDYPHITGTDNPIDFP